MDSTDLIRAAVRAAMERPGMRPPSGRVLVACSGGPDSRALLDALAALAPELGLSLAVACVDHGLRLAAAAEAESVVRAAEALGLPARVLRVHIAKPSMAAARRARYDALVAHAHEVSAPAIAVAHTATDQAETLLDRLVRGAGTRGLSAMPRLRDAGPDMRIIRPLLDVTREEVEAYVAARALDVSRDPTNDDLAYRRSRIRHEVLPLLRREPDLDRSLVALCDRLRADADHLDAEAERALTAIARVPVAGAVPRRPGLTLDVRGLTDLPDAIAARVLARAAGVTLEALHVDAIRRLCRTVDGTRTIDLPGGRVAERCYDRLRIGAPLADPGDVAVEVEAPGRYRLLHVEVAIDEAAWQHLGGGPLLLRNFRRGDRSRQGKLKDDFIDRRIPRPERRWLPLLVRRSSFGGVPRETVVWAPWWLVARGPVCNNVLDSVEAFAGSGHHTK